VSGEESITMVELNRYEVIKSLLNRRLTNKESGQSLRLSVHQIQRIKKRVFREGVRVFFTAIKPYVLFLRNSRQKC
jgi:predicted DNA binding CopG/RHH family protein